MILTLALPQPGEFVEVRGRRWLVEGMPMLGDVGAVRLACVDDDAQGEAVEVAWPVEMDARRSDSDTWSTLAQGGTDDPATFAAYLRTLEWNTAAFVRGYGKNTVKSIRCANCALYGFACLSIVWRIHAPTPFCRAVLAGPA